MIVPLPMISKPYFGVMNPALRAEHETFGRNNSKPPRGTVKAMLGSHMRLNVGSRAAIYAARARHSAGSRASLLVDLLRDEMALLIELVVDLGVN
jgi:hypothetical protein